LSDDKTESPYLCYCLGKAPEEIAAEIRRLGLRTLPAVYDALLRGGACHLCAPELEKLLAKVWKTADADRGKP
jgi:NAD(P)H-nitrite reductase large subunit